MRKERSFYFGVQIFGACPVEKKGRTVVIDINLIRKTPDVVRENIKKKFQDSKLPRKHQEEVSGQQAPPR